MEGFSRKGDVEDGDCQLRNERGRDRAISPEAGDQDQVQDQIDNRTCNDKACALGSFSGGCIVLGSQAVADTDDHNDRAHHDQHHDGTVISGSQEPGYEAWCHTRKPEADGQAHKQDIVDRSFDPPADLVVFFFRKEEGNPSAQHAVEGCEGQGFHDIDDLHDLIVVSVLRLIARDLTDQSLVKDSVDRSCNRRDEIDQGLLQVPADCQCPEIDRIQEPGHMDPHGHISQHG